MDVIYKRWMSFRLGLQPLNIGYINNIIISEDITHAFFAKKQYEHISLPSAPSESASSRRSSLVMAPQTCDLDNSLLTKILATSISSDKTLDWILLQKITAQKWETFKLFGFEITDSKILSKTFGLVIVVLVGKELSEIMNFWN